MNMMYFCGKSPVLKIRNHNGDSCRKFMLLHISDLHTVLKESIIEELNLEDMKPADIENDEVLLVYGPELASIEALELIELLEKD